MIHEEFMVYSGEGEKLRADLQYEPGRIQEPVALFVHGFKGLKNRGLSRRYANVLLRLDS